MRQENLDRILKAIIRYIGIRIMRIKYSLLVVNLQLRSTHFYAFISMSILLPLIFCFISYADDSSVQLQADFSGWRGGIGIALGTPSRNIPDISEMGYEISLGGDDLHAVKAMDISVFRYWNSVVETSLKGAGYDFSNMSDKDEEARLAFDAWMQRNYGIKGLSKYVNFHYHPEGEYGDVYGSMDLTSENELVNAELNRYIQGFKKDGIKHGGIGIDNAGKVP